MRVRAAKPDSSAAKPDSSAAKPVRGHVLAVRVRVYVFVCVRETGRKLAHVTVVRKYEIYRRQRESRERLTMCTLFLHSRYSVGLRSCKLNSAS